MSLLDADLKYEIRKSSRGARIKVVGVGGGGSNAVARMIHEGLEGVEFHVINTDAQALASSHVAEQAADRRKDNQRSGRGLRSGASDAERRSKTPSGFSRCCEGADMVFVTAGLGGGTGTGAAPVVASLAKELGALTIAVVTKPFGFEGKRKMNQADNGLSELAATVDTVIAIPNDRLLALVPRGTGFFESFRIADDMLRQAVQGISDIIMTPGLINRDFSDIKADHVRHGLRHDGDGHR